MKALENLCHRRPLRTSSDTLGNQAEGAPGCLEGLQVAGLAQWQPR